MIFCEKKISKTSSTKYIVSKMYYFPIFALILLTMRSLCIHHWLTVQFCSVHTVDMSTWSHVNKLNWIVYIFMINPKLLRINRSPWIHCSHCAYVWVHLTKPAHWVLFSFQTRTAHLSTRLLTFFCSAFTLLSCEK